MKRTSRSIALTGFVLAGSVAWGMAQTAPPAAPPAAPPSTAPAPPPPPATQTSADQMLADLLRPGGPTSARPLQPTPGAPAVDRTTGVATVAPNADAIPVLREGSFIVDRVGRLTKSADGAGWELAFESDGQALKDPPVVLLPSLKLMMMEDQVKQTSRDLKFRVTGQLTEYRGRNYLLLEKVVVTGN